MRRLAFFALGVLELCVAGILLALVYSLPRPGEIHDGMERAERVGQQASRQIHKLRDQLQAFRDREPELNRMTAQLQKHLQQVGKQLSNPQVDFKALEAVSDALADTARGVEGIAQALDPKVVTQMAAALGATATYLEEKVVPVANQAADQLEASTTTLKEDSERLSQVLRTVANDPQVYRQGVNRLNQVDKGLVWVMERSTPEQLAQAKEHLGSLRQQLAGAAREVDAIAHQTYPVLSFSDFVPVVQHRPLWPEGTTLATGLVQAADLIGQFQRYLGWLAERSEAYQAFLKEARTAVQQSKRFLETAMIQHAEMGPLFRELPAHAARFAEELPRIGKNLVRVLRDTARLKDVAVVLRQAKMGLDQMVESWPDLTKRLAQSVVVLRAVRKQLQYTLDHRGEYETALQEGSMLLKTLATSLPVFTRQVEHDLEEQVQSLSGLDRSISDVTATLPGMARSSSRVLRLVRLLVALLAGIFALHACYLLYDAWTAGPSSRGAHKTPASEAGRNGTPEATGLLVPGLGGTSGPGPG